LIGLEKAGIPTVLVVTEIFEDLARREAKAKGLPNARIVVVSHPLGGSTDEAVRQKAQEGYAAMLPLIGVDE
jgi:hypothetical protein